MVVLEMMTYLKTAKITPIKYNTMNNIIIIIIIIMFPLLEYHSVDVQVVIHVLSLLLENI